MTSEKRARLPLSSESISVAIRGSLPGPSNFEGVRATRGVGRGWYNNLAECFWISALMRGVWSTRCPDRPYKFFIHDYRPDGIFIAGSPVWPPISVQCDYPGHAYTAFHRGPCFSRFIDVDDPIASIFGIFLFREAYSRVSLGILTLIDK